jgi:YesN/AraC family two-component response regulator
MNKHVLLVEDEFTTQMLLKRMVGAIDPEARVDCVQTAEVAYRVLDDAGVNRPGYDLVICDLKLPGSDGLVLWNLCSKKHPELEFLFVSGVSFEDWQRRLKNHPEWPALMRKPINEVQLRRYWLDHFNSYGQAGA